jgi:hypothetical protein
MTVRHLDEWTIFVNSLLLKPKNTAIGSELVGIEAEVARKDPKGSLDLRLMATLKDRRQVPRSSIQHKHLTAIMSKLAEE